ncbi:MAG: DUF2723 domain-containing protein [Ardenticatenaceae bacterium]|nr:DUF2723 domain-containing protein [Ardenticatenaceae bacterium]
MAQTALLAAAWACLFVGGLALTRIVYEGLFPRWLWLARPLPVIVIAGVTAVLLTWAVNRTRLNAAKRGWFLLPLILNLLWLFDPAVDLVRSRLIFGASLWLAALLLARTLTAPRAWRWLGPLFVLAALLPVYLLTMPNAVGQADTFEFQVVAPQLGIAHPTGYPLFLLLGKLFTLIPLHTVAWRLNVAVMVYGLAAACLLFGLGYRLRARGEVAVVTAVLLGLTPTFWSQSIEAEVYTLHALLVVAALFVMREMGDWRFETGDWGNAPHPPTPTPAHPLTPSPLHPLTRSPLLLAFLLGLGMTNHLTTIFLLPAAALTLWFAGYFRQKSLVSSLKSLLLLALAFALPLLLYAYLPLRWTAVNHEPMGLSRFVDWVVGGRFQGALQWRAWLDDPTRYEVVGRIYLNNWGWVNLLVAGIGLIYLFVRRWQFALVLLSTWLGVTFYALNYYVPDLAVFLMGAQVVTAVFWLAGANWVMEIGDWRLETKPNLQSLISNLLLLLLTIPTLLLAVAHWPQIDQSRDDGLLTWGQGVLAQPLAAGAAILADSEKIAPLYYLQQAEGVRPDLDIMVLPDEAAYRAELDRRIAAGQTVYLARFLPGLEGVYHLRALGPLTEVSREPLTTLPDTAVSSPLTFDALHLLAYDWQPEAAVDPAQAALTLYWQPTNLPTQPTNQPLQVYLRLGDYTSDGRFPANNFYPTNAWKGDEIVPDFHLLPRPILEQPQKLNLQVALAPPFTPAAELDWQTITAVSLPATPLTTLTQPVRAQIGPAAVMSADFPAQIRPQQPLTALLSGYGDPSGIQAALLAEGAPLPDLPTATIIYGGPLAEQPFTVAETVAGAEANGRYQLILTRPGQTLICGWLQRVSAACPLGSVVVSGAPLPDGAINYDDKIALLDVDLADTTLTPGGQLNLTLHWQGLAPINDDYTVFLQVVDAQDRLVGQVDAWPLQGTLPTSQWTPGQTITDPYTIQLDPDMPPGAYRLLIGWYLLADLRRLPVLNADGAPVDDKLVVPGLMVE